MLLRRKLRVLLLDDDPSMQRLVSTLLKREGYRVDVFLTGREAIAAMEKEAYAVVLLDLMMPHEGGLTVIRHFEKKNPQQLTRVLVLTGSPDSVVGTVRNAVAGVVQKPFEHDELIGAVKRIADR
jgi:DNA-binding response OmpR family regulator